MFAVCKESVVRASVFREVCRHAALAVVLTSVAFHPARLLTNSRSTLSRESRGVRIGEPHTSASVLISLILAHRVVHPGMARVVQASWRSSERLQPSHHAERELRHVHLLAMLILYGGELMAGSDGGPVQASTAPLSLPSAQQRSWGHHEHRRPRSSPW